MEKMIYKDPNQSAEKRADDLLSRMTIDEKIDQMSVSWPIKDIIAALDAGQKPKINGTVQLYGGYDGKESGCQDSVNRLQTYVRENTRLGIPLLFVDDALHGVMHPDCTVFPQSIAMGSTFNEDLVRDTASFIGEEAYILGIRQIFSPGLDLAQDPRWGRVQEDYGEDPYLVSRMGAAYVEGVQSKGVAATLKHYAAHGSPEGGLNVSPVHMGEREMREMLDPFRECIDRGAMSVMPAYNEFDGIPLHASVLFLRDILRKELGFNGTVFSDYGAIAMLNYCHKTAKDALTAGKQAIFAGVDIEAPGPYGYGEDFRRAVKTGEIDIRLIDEAVRRILILKFRLGLFEQNGVDPVERKKLRSKAALDTALQGARESMVLLKNDGILPFNKNVKKIALIGHSAATAQLGDYTVYPYALQNAITPKAAMEARFGSQNIIYAQGSRVCTGTEEMLKDAEDAVKKADVAVVILGDNSNFFGGIGWGVSDDAREDVTSGEGFDVNDLSLPDAQIALFNRVKAVGKPVVLIVNSGRAHCFIKEFEAASAVLQMWYAGEQGATALAEILAGDINPSGKLTVSFPRSTGHIPCYYNHKPSARGIYFKPGTVQNPGRDYVFDSSSAMFPFGYGLSYTTFEYSELSAKKKSGTDITVSVRIKNTGTYDGAESVLLFISPEFCPVSVPVKRLRAFKKIFLKSGETQEVCFELSAKDFSYVSEDMSMQINTGNHIICIGSQKCIVEIN